MTVERKGRDAPPGQPPMRGWRIFSTALLAAIAATVFAKLAIVYRDHAVDVPMDNYPLEAMAASRSGLAVLFGLALIGVAATWLPRHPRRAVQAVLTGLLILQILVMAANIIAIIRLGRPFDLFWLTYVGTDNMEAMGTYLSAAVSPQLIAVAIACLIGPPVAAIMFARWSGLRPTATLALSALALAAAQAAIWLSPEDPAHLRVRMVRDDPVVNWAYQAVARYTLMSAADGTIADAADWSLRPITADPEACCRGADIILVTMDSVPTRRLMAAIAGRDPRMPVLAGLARQGVIHPAFYANYPASGSSLISTLTGIHPAVNGMIGDSQTLRDRDLTTFPEALGQAGYRTAFYMSGEMRNYGVTAFLGRHPVDETRDNATLRCPGDRRERMRLYNHPGDDCLAGAAARWIGTAGKQPYFLWLWLNGTHYPYYSAKNPVDPRTGESAKRFTNALGDADAALGILLRGLERSGQRDRTVLIITADHGEAFGEHGMQVHGTSVYEEQVNVPLIIVPPPGTRLGKMAAIGSLVDLGPTIVDMAGAAHRPGMQGRSLFDPAHGERAYFFAKAGGLTIGYRKGAAKYIFDLGQNRLAAYDLARDPGELRPRDLSAVESRHVRARLASFLRNRDGVSWPPRR